MISLDSETTGTDLRHGARPFFVTTCTDGGQQQWWEWEVDPLTRKVEIPKVDLWDIHRLVLGWKTRREEPKEVVLQNGKFDITALGTVAPNTAASWRWELTYDTLLAGHLLASNQPHDLASMALVYLGVDIQPYELALEDACKEARLIARGQFPEWRIAKRGLPEMPSAKGSRWKYDTWLPKRLAQELRYPDDHPWFTVLRDYSNVDSAVTLQLFYAQKAELERRGLWQIYLERLKLLPIVYKMEQGGVTLSRARLEELREEYTEESRSAERLCVNIAAGKGYQLTLPKSGNNTSLTTFVFDHLELPPIKSSKKTGKPSLDKGILEYYELALPGRSEELTFIRALRNKRKRDTALAYMEGYEKYWLPVDTDYWSQNIGWYRLHPSLNLTGTDTLRCSSSNPNEQNISKQEGFNLRYCFGPAPGREWYALDYENIELRIPAYEAGERAMIDLFERPDDPPYYGSYHLLVFSVLHPEKFKEHGAKCKEIYKSTYYQWTKNGNFAVQYGAVAESGTADRAYHVPGAQVRIESRFTKSKQLSQRLIRQADMVGYVETIPDRTVDPEHGYPLLCTRSEWGKVLPTVPLSYHVQGTAMWCMSKAMVRCQAKLDEWNRAGYSGRIALQVHDELVFDLPVSAKNPQKVQRLKELMELSGEDVGVPLKVSVSHHPVHWSKNATGH